MDIEVLTASSIGIGLLAYVGLAVFFAAGVIKGMAMRSGLVAAIVTALWLGAMLLLGDRPVVHVLENTAYLCWILMLARILGVAPRRMNDPDYRAQSGLTLAAIGVYLVSTTLILRFDLNYAASIAAFDADAGSLLSALAIHSKVAITLLGIVMTEQVARNIRSDHLWNIKLIIIGVATIFVYGFILFAEAMLFRAVNITLLAPQGIILAAAAPLIAIGSLRNRGNDLNLNISRRFVFRTGSITLCGSYLLIMSVAGYYVRLFGGEWGDVFLVILIVAAAIGLVLLLLSARMRRGLRIALLTNLYQYKYDYREEWLRLNRELTALSADDPLAVRAIRALAHVINAPDGAYWRLTENGHLIPCARFRNDWNQPLPQDVTQALCSFFSESDWIIDLDEYQAQQRQYANLDLDVNRLPFERARIIVPLFVGDRLFGIIMLRKPDGSPVLYWEDFDILKMIAQQVAGFLALQHLNEILSESERLRMMHQVSAFVVHDLKTVSAQMGLLLSNAGKHRDKPGFVDDMISTVQNSTTRIDRLLAQLRTPDVPARDTVDLAHAVRAAVDERGNDGAAFRIDTNQVAALPVVADTHKLTSAVGHIIDNARDALGENGHISVEVTQEGDWAIVTITDNGKGMTDTFIEHELFTPFVTTKGVGGIGIGAYQTREYVRSLGGDVEVRSTPGSGTRFRLRIPLAPLSLQEAN